MEERRVWKNRFLTLCLTLFFATPILAPLASADGMTTCDGLGGSDCDDYDSSDDGTPFQQDWIRGTYNFDLQDTTTIHMTLSWAIREFDRPSAWGVRVIRRLKRKTDCVAAVPHH